MNGPKRRRSADGSAADEAVDEPGDAAGDMEAGTAADKGAERQGDTKAEGAPERLYVVTGGRSDQEERGPIDLVTLVVAGREPIPGILPERAAVLRMCQFPLSVAEISAYLILPVSTVTVLLADLLQEDLVQVRAPVPAASLPDPELLQAVMHGLQNL